MQTQPAPMRISPIPQSQVRPDRGDRSVCQADGIPEGTEHGDVRRLRVAPQNLHRQNEGEFNESRMSSQP